MNKRRRSHAARQAKSIRSVRHGGRVTARLLCCVSARRLVGVFFYYRPRATRVLATYQLRRSAAIMSGERRVAGGNAARSLAQAGGAELT